MTAPTHSLSLVQWRRIDSLCDQFEAAWRQKARPALDEYLGRVEGPLRPVLLGELLQLELEWRLRQGEQPSKDDYATRFPDMAESLPSWLSAARQALAERTQDSTGLPGEGTSLANVSELSGSTQDFCPSHSPSQMTAHRLGEYDLLEPLGEGGMGQVWKARHRRLGKLVALKLIRPDKREARAVVARFLRETQAIGLLDHPNVVEASDAGEIDGTVFLVMKLIEGVDLAQYVRHHGPLPVAEACDIAAQVAAGLEYLHARGLVHRDLKPGNLMRTLDGTVKILDLGLARWQADSLTPSGDGTQTGQAMGTPDYMAPEQIAHSAAVDIRADLYALGATLFFLLTGQAPFGHVQGTFEKMKAHESVPPADVRTLRAEVPEGVAGLIAWLLEKVPADRPATPAEVVGRLKTLAADALPGGSARELPRRRWPVWPAAGAAGVLAAGVLVVVLAPRGEREKPIPSDPVGKPGIVDAPAPLADVIRPEVLQFAVAHARPRGEDSARELGLLGEKSFVAWFGDRAKVKVDLSGPAYGYLLAYAADGKEHLLVPADETERPMLANRLEYPLPGADVEYELNDGAGLHVFLAVISSEPLPAYAEWRRKQGQAPWGRLPGREGAVWRQVGGDLHATTAADPLVRGPGARQLGVMPVQRLSGWWRKQPGIEQVALTGFAVSLGE